MGRPTKNINGEKADAFITLRVTSDMKEQIKEEAELKEMTVSALLLKGFEIMKEGQYIDFK